MTGVHCAVVGSPITHSRSPVLHRAAYAALGLTGWTYDKVELQAEELPGWLAGLDESWRGISVTMPGKAKAFGCADDASELAIMLGAANTLVRTDRGWRADNTDVAGLVGALAEGGVDSGPAVGVATVVGAGGTAAAAVAALANLGYSQVDVVVRNPGRARGLVTLAERLGLAAQLHAWPGDHALGASLVISTVPAPATGDLLGHRWRVGQTVLDVSYDPWPSRLVEAAVGGGALAVGGAAVLLWQAAGQVELMTGHRAPVDAMREALLPGGTLAPA
ncbi:MAG: shikimate dehydrogenase [Actinomycetota bacterium]|nr:shikimate dehydrogenase [Actinomycetota bacterium]